MTSQYTAYGLRIASELSIPELTACRGPDSPPDVTIRFGSTPAQLANAVTRSRGHQSGPEGLLLSIEGVARYFVHGGSDVVVEPAPGATAHDIRVFLLGTCFGALLHQRGALVLHASGIGTPAGAVLFAGASGAGKSTLLAEMLRRGYRMMVDDVCAIVEPGDAAQVSTPVVLPSYPRTRLWADTARRLDVNTSGLPRTRSHLDKFERQLPDQFWDRPTSLRQIYHLVPNDSASPVLTRVAPLTAVPMIVAMTYRRVFLEGFGNRGRHFQIASAIARQVPIVQVERPTATFDIEELADRVIEDMSLPL